jgi:hypothetical protein
MALRRQPAFLTSQMAFESIRRCSLSRGRWKHKKSEKNIDIGHIRAMTFGKSTMQHSERQQIATKSTQPSIHVPHLEKKLKWLYRRHPAVKSHAGLARRLDVSPAFVFSWLNGTQCVRDCIITAVGTDRIPLKYFEHFMNIWGFPRRCCNLRTCPSSGALWRLMMQD